MGKAEHVSVQNITIESIDEAIHGWFDRTVDARVEFPNGELKKVPVVFSTGERWAVSRQRKGLRDANGVLILPLISVRRTAIEPAQNMQAMGTETPTLQVAKRISPKTNTLQNLDASRSPSQRLSPGPVVYEVTSIPFPDRSIMTFEVVVQTQYILQMNAILEKVFHELDIQKSFVAPLDNHHRHPQIGIPFEERPPMTDPYVVGFFDTTLSDSGNFEEFTDQERIIKYTTSIRVPTTLQLDPEGEKPSIKVERTAFGLNFGAEAVIFVDDPMELEAVFGPAKR
jgi:hypothetical protein